MTLPQSLVSSVPTAAAVTVKLKPSPTAFFAALLTVTRPSAPMDTPSACGERLQLTVAPTASPAPSFTTAVKGSLTKASSPLAGTVKSVTDGAETSISTAAVSAKLAVTVLSEVMPAMV